MEKLGAELCLTVLSGCALDRAVLEERFNEKTTTQDQFNYAEYSKEVYHWSLVVFSHSCYKENYIDSKEKEQSKKQ